MEHFKHHVYYATCPGLKFMSLASFLHHILIAILILSSTFHWNSKHPLIKSCTVHILILFECDKYGFIQFIKFYMFVY